MPDQAEVEQALAVTIAGALYPAGEGGDSAVGTVCRVYRGYPVVGALEADLLAGIAHLTVRAVANSLAVTTRFPREWIGAVPQCPLIAESDGDQVTFSGSAGPGTVAGVKVDGRAYAWRVTQSSTPGVVAAVLADMVRSDRPALLTDASISFPLGHDVLARAVSDGHGGEELRRQEARFEVTAWCPSPEVRDEVCAFVDLTLAEIAFLDVSGWGCRVVSVGGGSHDEGAAARAWRRDLIYRIEYPTVANSDLPAMLFGIGSVNMAGYLA